jgi:hypothetical protein
MATTHSSQSRTPIDLSDCIERLCTESSIKPITSQPSAWQDLNTIHFGYECDQTGDDHPDNRLDFYQLVELSAYLVLVFRRMKSDYYMEMSPPSELLARACHVLSTDIERWQHRISGGTVDCMETDPVKRNTVLRALVLFSIGGTHAADYLKHNVGERVAWIVQLNTSACWIKMPWERETARLLIRLIEKHSIQFDHICHIKLVYEAVFNYYFLMLFSRQSCSDLRIEMDTLGAGAFSWQGLNALRMAYWQRKAKEDDDID